MGGGNVEKSDMKTIAIMTAALFAAALALAQQTGHQGMDHQGMNHAGMMQPSAANPYGPDMMKMHERMMAARVPTPARRGLSDDRASPRRDHDVADGTSQYPECGNPS
jgi:hypothetical protein